MTFYGCKRTHTLLSMLQLLVCCLALMLSITQAYAQVPVKIGVLAFRPKPQTLDQWQPLAAALKTAIPERDFVVQALTFPELEAAVASRQVDFVLTNPGHYVLLTKRSGMSALLATLAVKENGKPSTVFGGVIFSRAAQDNEQAAISTLSDIKHKTIALTSTDSLGGYQMQAYELLNLAGIHLPQDAKLLTTGMPHDKAVNAVLDGRAQVGFVRTGVLEAMAREGKLDMRQIKVLNQLNLPDFSAHLSTHLYPEWAFAALPQTDEHLARQVAVALFTMDENTAAVKALGIHGFVVPADYTPVADMLKELRMPPFDVSPSFTLQDVWQRYQWQVVSALVALGLIALLGLRLFLTRRALAREHRVAVKQRQLLQESESSLQATLAAIPDLLFELGLDGRYYMAKSTQNGLLAVPSGELLGKLVSDVLPADAVAVTMQALQEANVDGHSVGRQFRLVLPEGERWFELSVSRKEMAANQPCHFIVLSRDITERKKTEEQLEENELHLRTIIDNEPECVKIVDARGNLLQMNPAGLAMIEADFLEQLVGHPVQSVIAPEYRTAYAQMHLRVIAGATEQMEYEVQGLKGGRRWLETHAVPIQNNGETAHLAVTRDITARKLAEKKLHLAASVFSHSREGIMITDTSGMIIDVNDAFETITGYGRDEVVGKNPSILSSGRHTQEYFTEMWGALAKQGHWYGEIWNRRKNGEVYAEMQTVSAVVDEQGETQQYVALFSDITAIKEHQTHLEHIAHYDALTGLPNRVLLADRLRQGMLQAQRHRRLLAVAFIDLDGFKAINDEHGHDAGDQLLIALSGRMRHALREGDTLSRIGGDEFVAVLVDLDDVASSVPMLNRLLAAAAQSIPVDELNLQVSASLGVTFYPQMEDIDADQLQRQADQAMYQAKLAGKNRYHLFDAEQDTSIRGHNESVDRIRRALLEREFELYYQPKVDMRTGLVVAAEALIRWQHPEKGLLPPAVFLPIIEDNALGIEVGEWVIDTALTQMERWHADGLDIPVSVNVGARQLLHADFVQHLRDTLAAHPEVAPCCLELEVLETSALEDMSHVTKVIEACREIGVKFALDDFGTGYSSLTYLKHLPVDLLKIDQSFVRDMLDDPDDLAILQGVIGLAAAFQRQVIAEGVESVEHGKLLLQLGCDLAQGYGIARPMPANEMPDWVLNWLPDASWGNQDLIGRENLPLIFAAVEHRAWIKAKEGYLKGSRDTPPPLDHQQCRLAKWLNGEGLAYYGTLAAFTAIHPLHHQVHHLAAELCELKVQGRGDEALARLGELHALRDALLAQFKVLALEPVV